MHIGMGIFSDSGAAPASGGGGGGGGIDISGASFTQFFSLAAQLDGFSGVWLGDDGAKMYATRRLSASLYQYDLSTGWDVSTSTYIRGIGYGQDSEPQDISLNPTGTRVFVTGSQNNGVHQGNLSTAWNLSSFTTAGSLTVTDQDATPVSHAFNDDGTKLFVLGRDNSAVFAYTLSTAYDVTTGTYDSVSFSVASQVTTETGLTFSPDGTQMFVVDSGTDLVFQYGLGTAWNIATASYSDISLDVSGQDTSPSDLQIRPDSSQMFLSGEQNNRVYQYAL